MNEFYFYILKCYYSNKFKYYKGITNNLIRRVKEHKSGKTGYTKRFKGNVELVYFEIYTTRSQARQREIKVKKMSKNKIIDLIRKYKGD